MRKPVSKSVMGDDTKDNEEGWNTNTNNVEDNTQEGGDFRTTKLC